MYTQCMDVTSASTNTRVSLSKLCSVSVRREVVDALHHNNTGVLEPEHPASCSCESHFPVRLEGKQSSQCLKMDYLSVCRPADVDFSHRFRLR